jgi:hypothetical protein
MENATSGEFVKALSRRDDVYEVEPSLLRWLYKTVSYEPAAPNRNMLGIVGFRNSYPNQDDLRAFMKEFRQDALAATFTVVKVNNGGYNPRNPGLDANGNVQYTGAMAYPTPLIFYSTGGDEEMWSSTLTPASGDAYLEWLNYIISSKTIPQTISISLTSDELGLPPEYAKPLCDLFGELGLLGVSVLVGSGDNGVGRGDCKDKSGNVWFNPTFPASCTCDISPYNQHVSAQIAYQIATFLQVPSLRALVARPIRNPRSRRLSPRAASRSYLTVRNTRTPRWPASSCNLIKTIPGSTGSFFFFFWMNFYSGAVN